MSAFRERLPRGDSVFGVFAKTASHQAVEVMSRTGLDFIVLDAEHAPFSPSDLDVCLLAARAGGLPTLVRTPDLTEVSIGMALDLGAAGVMVPRIQDRGQAERAAHAARYARGRGFSNSPRAGDYGRRSLARHATESDTSVMVVAMIEDQLGVDNVRDIGAVDGIDALFIGRVDLTIALGHHDVSHPDVQTAVNRIYDTAPSTGKALGALANGAGSCAPLHRSGVRMFLLGTDQSVLRNALTDLVDQARAGLL